MISVVIPSYNEEGNIEELVGEVVKVMDGRKYEIIVINDNSTDRTGQILDKLKKRFGMLEVVHRCGKRGVGFSLRQGFSRAKGDVIVTMDADLSHNPKDIPRLLDALVKNDADIVLGCRYCCGGGMEADFRRKIISGLFNLMARVFFRLEVKDITTGYRAHKKKVIEMLDLRAGQFDVHIEIPLKAIKKGYKVIEVPIIYRKRHSGKSKLDYKEAGPEYIKTFFRLLLARF